ncbi:MAG: TonB-dependent receptor, partial [Rhodothermales bacterium]|nr:TonB-dependent receptor [Rhodothermales bacterium]
LNDWAFVRVGTNLTRSFSNDVPTGGESFFDGAVTTLQFLPHNADAFPDELGTYPAPGNAFFGNPFEVIDTYDFTQEINRFTGSINLNLTPYEGLALDVTTGYVTYGQVARGFKPVGTVADPDGFTRRGDISRKLFNFDVNARYETSLTEELTSTTAVGGTWQYEKSEAIANEATNLGPIVQTIDGGTISSSFDIIAEESLRGGYVQETLGFRDKLFITAAGRLDGSSVFGEDNRSQFYPKLSGAYVISEESFWSGGLAETINLLKLRASLGKAGNLTGIGPFDRFTNYNPISFGGQTGLIPSASLGNSDIKPETQTELEIGADISLLQNRLGIEFTYYKQDVDDLLLERVLSPSTGATTRIENVGELTNKGIELMVRGLAIDTDDLDLDFTILFSRNRNKVTRLAEGTRFDIGGFSSQYAIEDQPLGVFYWRAYARDASGELLLTPDGLPQAERGIQSLQDACEVSQEACFAEADDLGLSPEDVLRDHNGNLSGIQRDANGQPTGTLLRLIVGDPNPDWTGSLITNVSYKKWSFRMQWDAVQGGDIFNWNRRNFDRHNYQ